MRWKIKHKETKNLSPKPLTWSKNSVLKEKHSDDKIYRVIQEERSTVWKVKLSVIVFKKILYEHVSNVEWVPT